MCRLRHVLPRKRVCQIPAGSPRRHEQRRGVFLLSHVYDDLLLSAATTAATPSGELSVRKRRQLLPKRH